jgi:DNA-binding CsgD family transcriptional regulator
LLELEYSGDNFAAKHVVARRANSAGSLSVETGGDPRAFVALGRGHAPGRHWRHCDRRVSGRAFSLLCRAYALSRRERELVALLVAGLDTRVVARRLVISPHTVQDHLKSVFEKIGIHSRRELLATLGASAD